MRVDVVICGRAEEKCLRQLPVAARLLPGIGGGGDVGGGQGPGGMVLADNLAVVIQLDGSIGHALVGGKHGMAHICLCGTLEHGLLG